MYYRSSLSIVTLRLFLKESSFFLNLEYRKFTIFCSFLLHVLTYWGDILHMTLFWWTEDQVWVSSICVSFLRSNASFWSKKIGNLQLSALFSYMLWYILLKFCICCCFKFTTDHVWVLSLCVRFIRSYASSWTSKINNLQFSALYMLWHILLKFCIWCCLKFTTDQVWVSSLCVNFWRSFSSSGTLNIGNAQFSAVFSSMLLHI